MARTAPERYRYFRLADSDHAGSLEIYEDTPLTVDERNAKRPGYVVTQVKAGPDARWQQVAGASSASSDLVPLTAQDDVPAHEGGE